MTGREFAGWTPSETHTHYAADGETVTGYTVVEHESRIDDADRADFLALAIYEAEVCTCGYHPLVANDLGNTFQPVDKVCRVCAGEAVWHRMQAKVDDDAKRSLETAPPTEPRPWDGRRSYMQILSPEEAAQARAKKGGD
jgi:hypothetical protein